MIYYLFEKYNKDINLKDNSSVIALTPIASYELEKAGIKHGIIDDFLDETRVVEQAGNYLADQLKWFSNLDQSLFLLFPEAKEKNIKLGTTFFYHIKLLVDAVILRSRVLDAFIKKMEPKRIVYIVNDCKNNRTNLEYPSFFNSATSSVSAERQSLFFYLIPLFCKKNDIIFELKILNDVFAVNNANLKSDNLVVAPGFKKYLIFRNYIRAAKNMFSYSSRMHRHKLLFLNCWYNNLEIMDQAMSTGSRCYYREGNTIKIRGKRLNNDVADINSDVDDQAEARASKFIESIYDTDIFLWINDQCGLDVRSIILSKLNPYFSIFFPQLLSLVSKYRTFYEENQIDMVLSSQTACVEEYAAIVACNFSKKTKSAYLPHGDIAVASDWIDFGEYYPKYDVYFTNNSEAEKSTWERIKTNGFKTKVCQNPLRYIDVPRVKVRKDKKKTLLYVPAMYQWDLAICLDTRIPDGWYFTWQKELIKFLSSRDDFNIIWKGIPFANQTCDPIPEMIKDERFTNIQYATEPFIEWIKRADMVLLDYPSTALYEATISGLPVMSLFYAQYNVLRKSALELFGRCLQPFHNFEEGIRKTEEFLNAETSKYVTSIPISKTSILTHIDSIITGVS